MMLRAASFFCSVNRPADSALGYRTMPENQSFRCGSIGVPTPRKLGSSPSESRRIRPIFLAIVRSPTVSWGVNGASGRLWEKSEMILPETLYTGGGLAVHWDAGRGPTRAEIELQRVPEAGTKYRRRQRCLRSDAGWIRVDGSRHRSVSSPLWCTVNRRVVPLFSGADTRQSAKELTSPDSVQPTRPRRGLVTGAEGSGEAVRSASKQVHVEAQVAVSDTRSFPRRPPEPFQYTPVRSSTHKLHVSLFFSFDRFHEASGGFQHRRSR